MGPVELARLLPAPVRGPTELVIDHLQHGTFQRSMALLVTGMEVAYEHYKGSYSNPVMYTPVILSGTLAAAGLSGFFSRRLAKTFLSLHQFSYAGRWPRGLWFSYPRYRTETGWMAPPHHQHRDGSTAVCAPAFRHECLSGRHRQLSAARGRSRHAQPRCRSGSGSPPFALWR